MDEPDIEIARAAISKLTNDPARILLDLSRFDAWVLLGTVQLAMRHPAFTGPTSDIAREIAQRLQASVCQDDPTLLRMTQMGEREKYDVPLTDVPAGRKRALVVGDVVQIDPEKDPSFGGCLLEVTEVGARHVVGVLAVPAPGGMRNGIFYRADPSEVFLVGCAKWSGLTR